MYDKTYVNDAFEFADLSKAIGFGFDRFFFENDDKATGCTIRLMNFGTGQRFEFAFKLLKVFRRAGDD